MAFGILSHLQRQSFWMFLHEAYIHTCSFSYVTFSSVLKGDCKSPPPFLSIGWKIWCRKAACKMKRSRSRQINTVSFGERRNFLKIFVFITLFISPLWAWEWHLQKLKIQNLPRIQRQGYFSVTSNISNAVPPICSSAWLAKFLYHAHSLAFHPISDLFCCLLIQSQLCSYLSHCSCFCQVSLLL